MTPLMLNGEPITDWSVRVRPVDGEPDPLTVRVAEITGLDLRSFVAEATDDEARRGIVHLTPTGR